MQVDVAVIEVGIGGAYDCTNIIRYDSIYTDNVIPLFKVGNSEVEM